MEKKPYLTDGIIGNSKMLGTLNMDGDLIRLWWPQITYPQHIKKSFGGFFMDGETEKTLWMNDNEFERTQYYIEDTNVLTTTAVSDKYKLKIELTDFAVAGSDTLVRNFRIYNTDNIEKGIKFLYYAAFQTHDSSLYGSAYFDYENDSFVHYKHKYAFAIGSNNEIYEFTMDNSLEDAQDGRLGGTDSQVTDNGCISFKLENVKPGESRDISIFISCGDGHNAAVHELNSIKALGYDKLFKDTLDYWREYLNKGRQITISNKEIEQIYKRSLLVFKLLSDEANGAIAAAPEIDEAFDKCGGYGYCWGRDAAYIVTAFDKAGCTDISTNFYNWAKRVQEKNGDFQQRYYMDGYLAPAWGTQIDEPGAILWGIYQHYELTRDMESLQSMWNTIKSGAEYLISFIDRDTGLPKPSMDLWEERNGEHLYSASSVFGGLLSASKASKILGFNDLADNYSKEAQGIKESIIKMGWKSEANCFLRGIKREINRDTALKLQQEKQVVTEIGKKGYTKYYLFEDEIVDISLLGITEPFNVIAADDPKMKATAAVIENRLWVPEVGGLKRYEDDIYIGGNPWILTTLWLALYKIKERQYDIALELLEWATNHSTPLGLLPEQIDKATGEPAWVIPLTWSHAMYVLTVLELIENDKL